MSTQLEFYMGEISKRIERLYEMSLSAITEAMKAFFDLDQEGRCGRHLYVCQIGEYPLMEPGKTCQSEIALTAKLG